METSNGNHGNVRSPIDFNDDKTQDTGTDAQMEFKRLPQSQNARREMVISQQESIDTKYRETQPSQIQEKQSNQVSTGQNGSTYNDDQITGNPNFQKPQRKAIESQNVSEYHKNERNELIIVNAYEGDNQITDHGNNQSGHNLMPQMQYQEERFTPDEYSKQISKHLTENIHTGVETLGNSVELNQTANISPYMQPTFNTKVRELILNSQQQERRLQESSQMTRGNPLSTKRTVLHVQNQQMYQTDRSNNFKHSREGVIDVVQRKQYDAASPRVSSREGYQRSQEQSQNTSRTATGRLSTRNTTRFGGGGIRSKPQKNSPAVQSLTNKSIISYDQYQNFINQYQPELIGQTGGVDQENNMKKQSVYGPAETITFAVTKTQEQDQSIIQYDVSAIQQTSSIGSQNPLLPFQTESLSAQISLESPRQMREVTPLTGQMIQFGLDQGPIKMNGYSGPFNKKTNLTSLKGERNLAALKNKDQTKNIFGGLNTANTLVTDAMSQNAMLSRVRIIRKTQNISPHVKINDQVSPDLKELKDRDPIPFGKRKNTIQHEPSIGFDDKAKDEMLQIQNRRVEFFLMSSRGQPQNSEKQNRLNQLNSNLSKKQPSIWTNKGPSDNSTSRGYNKDRITPQMALNAAEVADGASEDYFGGVPSRKAVDIATGISHDYADASAQAALRTGQSRDQSRDASQDSPAQSASRGTPAVIAEPDYLQPVESRNNPKPDSEQYEMDILKQIARDQVNIINHQILNHQMQTGNKLKLNQNQTYQKPAKTQIQTTPRNIVARGAAPSHSINISTRESGRNMNNFATKRTSFQQNQDLYDGQKLIFPSKLKSLMGTTEETIQPRKKFAVMGQQKDMIRKSELQVADSEYHERQSLAGKSVNFQITQPAELPEEQTIDAKEQNNGSSTAKVQELTQTLTITCDANPGRGGTGSPTITITPTIEETPEQVQKVEQIRVLTSPDRKGQDSHNKNGSVNTLNDMIVGTQLRPIQVNATRKQESVNELSPVNVSRMRALGKESQEEHTASFAQKSKLQEIILADGAAYSLEHLKTVSRVSRAEISPQSQDLSRDSLDQNIKSKNVTPQSDQKQKTSRSKSNKIQGKTHQYPKSTSNNKNQQGFKLMVPIKTKLYYAEMPEYHRPSQRSNKSPNDTTLRFGSQHSSQRARVSESPERNIVNVIARGGQRAADAIDQSYRAYKRSSVGEPQQPGVDYSQLQQRHFIIPKLKVQDAGVDQERTQDILSNDRTFDAVGQASLENDPLSAVDSQTTVQPTTERTTRLQNQTSPQDNINFGLAFPTLSPHGDKPVLVPQKSSESHDTQNELYTNQPNQSYPVPSVGQSIDQAFQFPPSYAKLNVGVDKKAPSTREPVRFRTITHDTHQNVTRESIENNYNSIRVSQVSARENSSISRADHSFQAQNKKQQVSVPPLFLACVGRAQKEENREKYYERASNTSSTLRTQERMTTGRILGAPLNTDTRTAADIAEIVALKQVQFPTKRYPMLPQQEKGIIRFKHDDPPPNYTLGMTQTTLNGFDPDAGLTHRQKLGVMRNERAKMKNLKEQHAWKLKVSEDQVQKGLKIQLNMNRQTLVKQFLREDQERRRMFGGLDENTVNRGFGSRRISMGQTSSGFSGISRNYIPQSMDNRNRNNVSSSRAEHMKYRLTKGLTSKYTPENQKNFLAPIQRRPGFSTTLPGARFNQKEKLEHGIETRGGTPHRLQRLVPEAIRTSTRGKTIDTNRHKPLSIQIQQELAKLTTEPEKQINDVSKGLKINPQFRKNKTGHKQSPENKELKSVNEQANGTIFGTEASVLQTRENLLSPPSDFSAGHRSTTGVKNTAFQVQKNINQGHVKITSNHTEITEGVRQETFSDTQAQIIAKYTINA